MARFLQSFPEWAHLPCVQHHCIGREGGVATAAMAGGMCGGGTWEPNVAAVAEAVGGKRRAARRMTEANPS